MDCKFISSFERSKTKLKGDGVKAFRNQCIESSKSTSHARKISEFKKIETLTFGNFPFLEINGINHLISSNFLTTIHFGLRTSNTPAKLEKLHERERDLGRNIDLINMADFLEDLFSSIGGEILLHLLQKSIGFEGRISGVRHWQRRESKTWRERDGGKWSVDKALAFTVMGDTMGF